MATDVTCQYVWDPRYIDAPVCRDKDADDDEDCTETDWDTGDDPDEHLYYCQDANFNTTALVERSDGSVVERYVYDPYGKVTIYDDDWSDTVAWGDSKKNEVLYCGYRYDHESRLYHVRHRYYHPTLGRWMQRDPLGYADGMSLYEYVGSRPACIRDPHGLRMYPDRTYNDNPHYIRETERRSQWHPDPNYDPVAEGRAFRGSWARTGLRLGVGFAGSVADYKYADDLLYHGLNGSGSPVWYDATSDIAQDVVNAESFGDVLVDIANKIRDTIPDLECDESIQMQITGTVNVENKSGRLLLAFHRPDITYTAFLEVTERCDDGVCCSYNEFEGPLSGWATDTYNYHKRNPETEDFGIARNTAWDLAYTAQRGGQLTPFDIYVQIEKHVEDVCQCGMNQR